MRKVILSIILLIIIAIVGIYITRNQLVKSAIEEGTDYSLGVSGSVGSVNLDIQGSSCGLEQYQVKNPEGFDSENLFSISRGYFDVDAGSVFDDELVIDSLIFDSIVVTIEQQDTKTNFQPILDHIKKLDLGSSDESQKKVKIGKIAFKAVTVDLQATLLNKDYTKKLTINDFTMTDIGGKDGTTVSGVISRISKELLSRSRDAGLNNLPDEYKAKLQDLKESGVEQLKEEVTDQVKDLLGG